MRPIRCAWKPEKPSVAGHPPDCSYANDIRFVTGVARRSMRRVVGIDVGGTFTDLLLYETGAGREHVRLAKIPTTAANQADGVLAAIAAGRRGAGRSRPRHPRHHGHHQRGAGAQGRQGRADHHAGFRDIARAGPAHPAQALRHDRHLRAADPARAAPRGRRAHERARRGGDPARRGGADGGGEHAARGMGCESLVIHFLHAYANPAHELRAGEIARALWPNDYVTLGHELLSEFREYERGTTASVNAAVQPILDRYVRRLQGELEAQGFKRDLLVMNGNGGTVSARVVARDAAKTIMSGPASGVMAASATLAQSGAGQRHHLRHGRHLHRRGADPRRRAAGVRRADHRLRPADPRADGGRAQHRRRRRLDRLDQCGRHAAGRAAVGGLRARADLLRPRRRACRPSPMPTWCSAGSTPSGCWRCRRRSTLEHVRAIFDDAAGAAARLERRRGGSRRDPARQHAHGRRHPHGVAVARARSARLHAVRLRRRRAAACGGAGARARHSRGADPGAAGADQCARLPGRRPAPGLRQHAERAARRASTWPRCMRCWRPSASAASPSTPRSRARSSRPWCCTAPTCSSAARRT